MIIRCERCSTVYELDDDLLPPEGSDVQCARCQHVFRARPPHGAGDRKAVESRPPAPPPQAPPPPQASVPPAPSGRRPAVYRPPTSQPSVPRTAVLRRDAVGTFESRLRRSHRWKWLAPALLVGAVAAGTVVYLARGVTVDHGAEQVRARALSRALADDVTSLEQAAAELQRVVDGSRHAHAARADRALLDLLLAGALSEREPRGPGQERARALVASANATLDELAGARLATPEVARARAVAASLSGDRAALTRLATAARAELPDDVFVAVAEHTVEVRSVDRGVRDRAVSALELLLARRPELVRARYLLAKGLALSGRRSEALATIEDLLRRNGRHEAALALREAIIHPPSTVPIAGGTASAAAASGSDLTAAPAALPRSVPAEKADALPRKPDSTGGQTRRSLPAEGTPDQDAPAGAVTPAEVEPTPSSRLRPAEVPEPEVVEGGG